MAFPFDPSVYRTASQRRCVLAKRGMVCASQPLAAQAGVDMSSSFRLCLRRDEIIILSRRGRCPPPACPARLPRGPPKENAKLTPGAAGTGRLRRGLYLVRLCATIQSNTWRACCDFYGARCRTDICSAPFLWAK